MYIKFNNKLLRHQNLSFQITNSQIFQNKLLYLTNKLIKLITKFDTIDIF